MVQGYLLGYYALHGRPGPHGITRAFPSAKAYIDSPENYQGRQYAVRESRVGPMLTRVSGFCSIISRMVWVN